MGTPQAGGAPASGTDMLMQFLPLILMFVIFWFLLIRPQQKRAKADDEQVLLESGDAKLRISRAAIGGLLPAKGGKEAKPEEKK